MLSNSPYANITPEEWKPITLSLIEKHPLAPDDIVQTTLDAWESIFESSIGGLSVGVELLPSPQMMGNFLHELIAYRFAKRYPELWARDSEASEKDLVYLPDELYSIEIKTSSHRSNIFGNRSYAQPATGFGKKSKAGYYIAVNFDKFSHGSSRPDIARIRFGWLEHSDWKAQRASTGQQASLTQDARVSKLIELFPSKDAQLL